MKILRTTFKIILAFICLPVLYFLIALILTYIPVNTDNAGEADKSIYVTTNGVHLDIVLPTSNLSKELKDGLKLSKNTRYLSFGWGDRNFYLNTPEWSDLTFGNAVQVLFVESKTLMHVSRYRNRQSSWRIIQVTDNQLSKINEYIQYSFSVGQKGQKTILAGQGYTYLDDFYEAQGSYSLFNTCNSWVNTGLKQAGIKACLWTPFDFQVIALHTPDDN